MAATLAGFREYARINPDEDTATAELCYNAAIAHASGIDIDVTALADNAKYALYIYALALHWYDNRGLTPSSQAYAVDEYTRRITASFKNELRALSKQLAAEAETETEAGDAEAS